ncbi:DUF1653 domain-containing protein [Mesorhizobium sp. AR07]|uniref:DUF1653 domain-containing protein n=1 Tax=Mesorhizobium sp. AR07 TaxID=2865838 RepID=UPI002203A0F4|nr:DUF1653 domain-containing protein [Mesorhizobium sp. AR07]
MGIGDMRNDPQIGQSWQHHSGRMYQVILVTNTTHPSDKFPVTVVYQNMTNATVWSRPLSDWHRSFTEMPS